MKPSTVLRKAARLIECGMEDFGCNAISNSDAGIDDCIVAHQYFKLLAPNDWRCEWFGDCMRPANQKHRAFALDLAAAIAESEGS